MRKYICETKVCKLVIHKRELDDLVKWSVCALMENPHGCALNTKDFS